MDPTRTHKSPFPFAETEGKRAGERRESLAADAVVVVVVANAVVVRISMGRDDGKAEDGQAKNGQQNLFHFNLRERCFMPEYDT